MNSTTTASTMSVVLPPGFDIGGAQTLDDQALYRRLDPQEMHNAIDSLPEQLLEAERLASQVDWLSYKPTTPAGVCICGIGGSAIGGDLVRSYWESESPVPMTVVRSDRLPTYINRFWMVIASSYSGNTGETLASVEEARTRGCNILALTSGGRLATLARESKWPLISVPGGMMPRAALGYSFGPVFMALARWGIVPDRTAALREAADKLVESQTHFSKTAPHSDNLAKQVAAVLRDRIVCVYGTTGVTDVAATRWKCQICENSKVVAFANALPELNHNEIVGMDAAPHHTHLSVIMLESGDEDDSARRRMDWVTTRFAKRNIPVVRIVAIGFDRLSRLLSLVQFGDYVSYYLAILSGQDPTPIPAIAALKAELT